MAATANSGKIAPPGFRPSVSTTAAASPATTEPTPRAIQDSASVLLDSPSWARVAPMVTHAVSSAPAIDWRRKRLRVGSYFE